MNSTGSRPASAVNRVRMRETEGPGSSSDRLGQIPYATRCHIESYIPGRHRGQSQRRAGIGARPATSTDAERTGCRQWHTNPMLRGKEIAAADRVPKLRVGVLGGGRTKTACWGRFFHAQFASGGFEESAANPPGRVKRGAPSTNEAQVPPHRARIHRGHKPVPVGKIVYRVSIYYGAEFQA